MLADFNTIPDCLHLHLEHEAFSRAARTIAGQADILANEYEAGTLPDTGGAAALRLMAEIVRMFAPGSMGASRA